MKGLILLANYFEDVEALITIDMLRRAKIEIDLVSITEDYNLITQSGVKLQADYLIDEIDLDKYAFLIIPGGKAVFETNIDGIYKENERVVVSDHIITSKAAGTTFDFAFAIIKYLANEEVANMVLHNVYYK